MTVREDILSFLRDAAAFSRTANDPEVWLDGLRQFALPMIHGLRSEGNAINHAHAFEPNKAGHSGDLAPGQGSPFTGEEKKTPATDTDAANEHANVKDQEAK